MDQCYNKAWKIFDHLRFWSKVVEAIFTYIHYIFQFMNNKKFLYKCSNYFLEFSLLSFLHTYNQNFPSVGLRQFFYEFNSKIPSPCIIFHPSVHHSVTTSYGCDFNTNPNLKAAHRS